MSFPSKRTFQCTLLELFELLEQPVQRKRTNLVFVEKTCVDVRASESAYFRSESAKKAGARICESKIKLLRDTALLYFANYPNKDLFVKTTTVFVPNRGAFRVNFVTMDIEFSSIEESKSKGPCGNLSVLPVSILRSLSHNGIVTLFYLLKFYIRYVFTD